MLWPLGRSRPGGSLMRGVVGAALAVAVLVGGYAVTSPVAATVSPGASTSDTSSSALSQDRLAALADHLCASGAVFYGAYWCPHCQEQKEASGASAGRLPYVECDPRGAGARPDLCQAAGVRAYPTWVIGGQKLEGEIPPADLARLSGFGG